MIKHAETPLNRKLQMLVEDCYNTKFPEDPLLEVLKKGTDVEIAHVLDECPSLVNEPLEFGSTPLHIAIQLRRYSVMELLLLRGADPRKRDVFGDAPLHEAISGSDYEATQILLHFSNESNLLDGCSYSLLEVAARYSSSKVISLLLSSSIEKRGSLIRDYSWNAFELLAKKDPLDCDDEDEIEAIAYHLLNFGLNFDDYGGRPCDTAVQENNCQVLRVLLNLGAKFRAPKEGEYSAFHLAGLYATLDTIELLREANIKELDPDAECGGWTAMEFFEDRETCRDGELLPTQTRPTAEEFIAFEALINEAREQYNNTRILLEANDQEVGCPVKSGVLLGEDGKVVGKQASLPGAWIE